MVVDEKHEDTRGAKTQSLYRDVNERVTNVNAGFNPVLPHGERFCECADITCDRRIAISPEDHESIRASGNRFAVAPDHVYADIADVVGRRDGYWIVEKRDAAALAAKFDPRARVQSSS